ncbi:MAG: DUF664 domain-containing protein [Sediminicola sp.]|tara:strand:- start:12609 stop:13163 length:555 start_codon:yes stop_codon:yes gene_type:complete
MKALPFLLPIFLFSLCLQAQRKIEPPEGYSHDIGTMIVMLDNLKGRVESMVKNLDQESTDFLMDDESNRIGAIIYHLAATEAYYQVYTFENRGLTDEENAEWEVALNLGDAARKKLKEKPIGYYLDIYDKVREKTKTLLKTKDDTWFAADNGSMSNQFAWFHVMEHQANHMGQLALITKRLPKN